MLYYHYIIYFVLDVMLFWEDLFDSVACTMYLIAITLAVLVPISSPDFLAPPVSWQEGLLEQQIVNVQSRKNVWIKPAEAAWIQS